MADRLASGTSSIDDLARECGADRDALYRLLRAAASLGVCSETGGKRFAPASLGETLRSDAPGSLRDLIIAETAPGHWLPWGKLADAVRSGASTMRATLGVPDPWTYYAKNAEEGKSFARGMGNLSAIVSADVARVYQPKAQRIVDVGGSEGVLLRGLLERAPGARGVLFDRAEVVAHAKPSDRIEVVSGDFFAEVPAGGDLYVLKSILHDWPDDRCEVILKNCHRAAAPGARLLVVEMILPEEGPVAGDVHGHEHAGDAQRPRAHGGRVHRAPRAGRMEGGGDHPDGRDVQCGGGGARVRDEVRGARCERRGKKTAVLLHSSFAPRTSNLFPRFLARRSRCQTPGGLAMNFRPHAALESNINVTPLVDVCLVLLIIFMLVLPAVVNGIPVKLQWP